MVQKLYKVRKTLQGLAPNNQDICYILQLSKNNNSLELKIYTDKLISKMHTLKVA